MAKTEEDNEVRRLPLSDIRLIKEKPFSPSLTWIARELICNALDASATTIKVEIEDAGLGMIQVADNGTGISEKNLPKICNFFATSKARSLEDALHSQVVGFKGTTLANLSCIANVSVLSQRAHSQYGFQCEYVANLMVSRERQMAKTGTTVEVRNLWYNFPETRAEQKTVDPKEMGKMLVMVAKYAIAFPHVVMEVTVDEREKFKSAENKSDVETMRGLLNLGETDILGEAKFEVGKDVKGTVLFSGTKTNVSQKVRGIFVNRRLVKVPGLKKAMNNWYSEMSGIGQPVTYAYVIMLEIAEPKMKLEYLLNDVIELEDEAVIAQTMVMTVAAEMQKAMLPGARPHDTEIGKAVSPLRRPVGASPVVRRFEGGAPVVKKIPTVKTAGSVPPAKTPQAPKTTIAVLEEEAKPIEIPKPPTAFDPVSLMVSSTLTRTRSVGDVQQEGVASPRVLVVKKQVKPNL